MCNKIMYLLFFLLLANLNGFFVTRYWLYNEPFKVPAWKMDPTGFEAARARTLTKRKLMVPLATQLKAPSSSFGPSVVVIENQSSQSASLSH